MEGPRKSGFKAAALCTVLGISIAGGSIYLQSRYNILGKAKDTAASAKNAVVDYFTTDASEAFGEYMKEANEALLKDEISEDDIAGYIDRQRELLSPQLRRTMAVAHFKEDYKGNLGAMLKSVDVARKRMLADMGAGSLEPQDTYEHVQKYASGMPIEQGLELAGELATGAPNRQLEDHIIEMYKTAVVNGANGGRMMFEMGTFSIDQKVEDLKRRYQNGAD
jgi:hypothetical protein